MPNSRIALPWHRRVTGFAQPVRGAGGAGLEGAAILGDEVDGLAGQAITQAITSVAAALIAATFVRSFHQGLELAWLMSILVLEAARVGFAGWYRRRPNAFELQGWKILFTAVSALGGAIWGGFIAYAASQVPELAAPAIILPWLAIVVSSIALGRVSSRAAVSAVIPLLLLPALGNFLKHDHLDPALGIGLALCLGGAIWAVFLLENAQRTLAAARREIAELKAKGETLAYRHARDNARNSAAFNGLAAAVAIVNQDMVLDYWNPAFATLYPPAKSLDPSTDHLSLKDVIAPIYENAAGSDAEQRAATDAFLKALAPQSGRQTIKQEHTDPSGRLLSVSGCRLPDGGWVITVEDVSGKHQAATNAIIEASRRDPLTGLPNRVAFRRALERAITQARRENKILGVAILNICAFKNINDTMGAQAGDEVLRHVATCLVMAKEKSDIIGRIGGDEFAIAIGGEASGEGINDKVKNILRALRQPIAFLPSNFTLDAYAGATIFPDDNGNAEELLRSAGIALGRARSEHANAFVNFDHTMDAEQRARAVLVEDIRRNLNSHRFVFHYQPQIDLHTKELVGVEALLRWNHPERGWQSPDSFIPTAELSRLIIPLTERMIPEACEQIKIWDSRGLPHIKVAINLSPIHLMKRDFPSFVESVLKRIDVDPRRLEFEITESAIIGEHEDAQHTLAKLREIGVSLSIDDFGTGYASIGYLRRIPVNKIKIDRSFIREIEHDAGARSIVKAIAGLGHSFRLDIVAEGVEKEEHERLVADLGCNIAQGYYYSRPIAADNLSQWVEAHYRSIANGDISRASA